MKKLIILTTVILITIFTAVLVGSYFYLTRTVDVYGVTAKANANEIDLSNAQIDSLDGLINKLSGFLFLKKLELGDYPVTLEDEDRLLSGFPGVEVNYIRHTELYGDMIPLNETSLDLSNKNLTDTKELSNALKDLTFIKNVNLTGNNLSLEQMKELAKAFPDIAFRWNIDILGETYDSKTEELDFSGNKKITPELIREYIPLFTNLKRLDMSDCGATNEEMAALREDFPDVKVVWRIHMGRWSLKTDAVAFSVLIYDYSHKRLTSKDIEVLKYCTDLQALDIGHQAVTDISVLGDYLPELRILILADNQVSDLTPVKKMKHLHYIELFVNSHKLTDISPLAECKELVDVNISYLHNVRDISPLFDLPLLERVWIEHMPAPAAQIQTLKEKHPDAKVVNVGKGSVDKGWRTHERYYAMIGMFHDKNCSVLSESFSKYDNK